MRVKCLSAFGQDLPLACLDAAAGYDKNTIFPIKVGQIYVVYALTTYLNHVWYHIWDSHSEKYPGWAPSPLFEVADPRLSKYWVAGTRPSGTREVFTIGYREWVQDEYHCTKLVDGDHAAIDIFENYKSLMDSE
jgi:hypothetical protein